MHRVHLCGATGLPGSAENRGAWFNATDPGGNMRHGGKEISRCISEIAYCMSENYFANAPFCSYRHRFVTPSSTRAQNHTSVFLANEDTNFSAANGVEAIMKDAISGDSAFIDIRINGSVVWTNVEIKNNRLVVMGHAASPYIVEYRDNYR